MRLLTTPEVAEYLRIKERKVYELISEGAIPCTKAVGKWLFPQDEIDRWLAGTLMRPDNLPPAEPMPIVGGSHDPLLEWALRESGAGLATLPEGSQAGLRRFIYGELVAAAIHLHAIGDADRDANVDAMRSEPALRDAVLIGFARREAGLLTAPGNPLQIADLRDVARRRVRLAVRPEGAGAQLLLLALLHRLKIPPDQVSFVSPPCPTGSDVAQAIRAGRADCGLAIRAVADAAGLEFLPVAWERFDLAVRQRHYFRPQLQTFIRFVASPALAERAAEFGGYDLADAGRVRFAP